MLIGQSHGLDLYPSMQGCPRTPVRRSYFPTQNHLAIQWRAPNLAYREMIF